MPRNFYNICFSIFCLILFISDIALADIWKCGETYTNNPGKRLDCKEIEGSKVCGGEGNKYFSPKRLSGSNDEPCKSTASSASPLVNMKLAESQGNQGKELHSRRGSDAQRLNSFKSSPPPQVSQESHSIADAFGKLNEILGGSEQQK